ncbi:hypothetical protein J437_LFUL018788 [Ladona fulva]|uniref:DDE Tnp4 domain-containing protein n=1 Tax=Ladona fulva TaxID=123851 RepID=A0A8K0KPK5_LADFU|nr:hypothetical protein J437_LFUL018788 [Ladona fulva]
MVSAEIFVEARRAYPKLEFGWGLPGGLLPNRQAEVLYVFVADDAFPPCILKPHPNRDLTEEKRNFNYRLSRARRIVENAFGILIAPIVPRIFGTMLIHHVVMYSNNVEEENEYLRFIGTRGIPESSVTSLKRMGLTDIRLSSRGESTKDEAMQIRILHRFLIHAEDFGP